MMFLVWSEKSSGATGGILRYNLSLCVQGVDFPTAQICGDAAPSNVPFLGAVHAILHQGSL